MLHTHPWSPNPTPKRPPERKSHLGEGPKRAKGYLNWSMRQVQVLTLPPLGSYVSWTPLEPEMIAMFVLSISFLSYSLSPNSLFAEFWVTENWAGLEFAKLNRLSECFQMCFMLIESFILCWLNPLWFKLLSKLSDFLKLPVKFLAVLTPWEYLVGISSMKLIQNT